MSPITITALILFAITCILMLAFQKIRPYVTVTSAVVFVILGIIASANPALFGESFFNLTEGSYTYGIMDALSEIDWNVIMMIAGTMGSGSKFLVYTIIVWMSVLLSAFIDNIPYTATMLSIVPVIASELGMEPTLLYYGLLCGATLGGNLTPIGASANITGIGILRKEGYEVKSTTFMKYGVPFTLAAVITGYILLWVIWA